MAVSYKKLWKLLIDKGLNKTQLCAEAGITTNAMARLGRDEDVRVEVLVKICSALNCTMDDNYGRLFRITIFSKGGRANEHCFARRKA